MEQQAATNAGQEWIVRAARDADYRVARILLPQAVHFGSGAMVLLAESICQQQVIAAAALAPRYRSEGLFGARVAVHVTPPWRRRGVATELLKAAGDAVRPWGVQALFAWHPVQAGSDEERCWRTLRFR